MTSHAPAYAVPFWVDRRKAPQIIRLVNLGDEPVDGLRVTLVGSGHLVPVAPRSLEVGRAVHLTLVGIDSSDSVGVIRWFRPDGTEYLWRFSF